MNSRLRLVTLRPAFFLRNSRLPTNALAVQLPSCPWSSTREQSPSNPPLMAIFSVARQWRYRVCPDNPAGQAPTRTMHSLLIFAYCLLWLLAFVEANIHELLTAIQFG